MMTAHGDGSQYEVFETIAACVMSHELHQAKAALVALDARHATEVASQQLDFPSDASFDRWRPCIDAAYFFGLALGLRLAGAVTEKRGPGGS
jgi:hypothetical protein